LWFVTAASAGPIAIAVINARLYGSPLVSGYGDLPDAYSLAYVLPNLRRYPWWIVTAETPLMLAGLACLVIPVSRVWPARESREARWLLAGVAIVVWVSYLLFVPWDAWWYLRYLLPCWPMMAIGTASLVAALFRTPSLAWRRAAVGLVAAIGIAGLAQAIRHGVLSEARGEAKYIEVAKAVDAITSPDEVIISAQHSGSIRYYAGRLTLRWDYVDANWLDRTVDWLEAHGHHPYFVLEDPEIETIRARFPRSSSVARLDWTPVVIFRGGQVKMFDAIRRDRSDPAIWQPELGSVGECSPQKPAPRLR
jgi:hypothetical protein